MDYRILSANITDKDINLKLSRKINFQNLDKNKEYDVYVEYYNKDLINDVLNDDVSYEIKRSHYKFIRTARDLFKKNNLKINNFNLLGTINDLSEDEMVVSLLKTTSRKKSNVIWPCKEVFIYEDSKNKLDDLLYAEEISEEEYESNLEDLKYELSIYENDEEHGYIN